MASRFDRLTDPRFVLSLLVLALNDHVLKQAWPGMVTGKLSDFAGLFAFGWFCIAVVPSDRRVVLGSVALLFAWWKSPNSQWAIEQFNAMGWLEIGRVVDPRDLMAILLLPVVHSCHPIPMRWPVIVRPLLAALSLILFTATSMVRYASSGYQMDQEWAVKGDRRAFWASLEGLGLSPVLDTNRLSLAPYDEKRVRYCWNHFTLGGQHINSATIDVWGGKSRTHARLVRIEPVEDSTHVIQVNGERITMHYGAAQAYYRKRFKEQIVQPMKEAASRR